MKSELDEIKLQKRQANLLGDGGYLEGMGDGGRAVEGEVDH